MREQVERAWLLFSLSTTIHALGDFISERFFKTQLPLFVVFCLKVLIGPAAMPIDGEKTNGTPGTNASGSDARSDNRKLFQGVGGTALSVALANGKAAEKARDAALALVTTLEQALAENHETLIQKTKEYAGARFAAQRVTAVEAKLEACEDVIRSLKEALSQAEKRALGFQVALHTLYSMHK